MAISTKIQWANASWNPCTGCTEISPGCKLCYAKTLSRRLQGMEKQVRYVNGFTLTMHEEALAEPLKWKQSKTIFVNSMSDLFHKDVSDAFIKKVFAVMNEVSRHRFRILTKRSERLRTLASSLTWTENILAGVTVESNEYLSRVDDLRQVPARTKFLSLEPLLGPLPDLDLTGINWVIVGGESGAKARPMQIEWVRAIRDKCLAEGVLFNFKQWGGWNKKKAGSVLDGRLWTGTPEAPQGEGPDAEGIS